MTEQSTLLTLLLIRLDNNCTWTTVVGQLRTLTLFLQMWMPKYLHPHISVNDVS